MNYRIFPPEEILEATIGLPLSKSYMARKMLIDAIAGAPQTADTGGCTDLEVLKTALTAPDGPVDLQGAGTALRLLTAYFAATPGRDVTLDGNESLRRRPMHILVDALRQLGADISYEGREGFAPLHIRGRKLAGGSLPVDPTVSSQFITALMLISPMLEGGLRLRLEGEAVSTPYIKMTAEMMRRRGAVADIDRYDIDLSPGNYSPADNHAPELDWSAASYWYETAALTAGWLTLPGLHRHDLQGDRYLTEVFPRLGVLSDFEAETDDGDPIDGVQLSATPDLWGRLDLDLSQHPDLTPALAVTAAVLSVPFRFTGVDTLRVKECDRVAALQQELLKIGVVAETEGTGILAWDGARVPVTAIPAIDPHGDHRIAMAFAPVAVFAPGMIVLDHEVVDKSYPDFWRHLQAAGFTLEEVEADR